MKFISFNQRRITPFFALLLFVVSALFMHSCESNEEQSKNLLSENSLIDLGDSPTEDELIAHMEELRETQKPRATNKMDLSLLDRNQKEIYLESQSRYGNCDPGFAGTDYSRTISVSNSYFSASVNYTYRYFTNGGVSITDMTVTPNSGFWADQFIVITTPHDSPNYSSIFNFYRNFLYAFIASAIDADVVAQPNVVDYANSGGFIFFNVENKFNHTCWKDPATGTCSGPTCCQRYSWYWSDNGTAANFGRYLDANGYAVIQGGTSTIECAGSGSNCGPATWNSVDYCDNSQWGFNSLQ